MATLPKPYITPEQYLEIERKAEYRSEYLGGEMFSMPGGTLEHSQITAAILGEFARQLMPTCQPLTNDMRVHVPATGIYTYPDVSVVCGDPQLLDAHSDTLLNPILLVEVLSPSTEAYDRGRKFDHYSSIPSLRYYLLVASDRVSVHLFARDPGVPWTVTQASRPEDVVELDTIGCRLKVADIYARVKFEPSR